VAAYLLIPFHGATDLWARGYDVLFSFLVFGPDEGVSRSLKTLTLFSMDGSFSFFFLLRGGGCDFFLFPAQVALGVFVLIVYYFFFFEACGALCLPFSSR